MPTNLIWTLFKGFPFLPLSLLLICKQPLIPLHWHQAQFLQQVHYAGIGLQISQ